MSTKKKPTGKDVWIAITHLRASIAALETMRGKKFAAATLRLAAINEQAALETVIRYLKGLL